MTYIPFARKHRPQDFDGVIGQEHITTTLKNAISLNRVHHAYLFAGPRGIGKTSTARILSKALNCEKGPTPTPCNKCVSCQEITGGSSMDVIEIDGASNRGIDEIRNLRETVKYSPSNGRYKIYIIDEVHMLTTEAFNALLKTLEEPPAHVKFIFATTEPHKLPATILSRCQRFDFRRIPVKDIIAKLKELAVQEKLDIEEDVFLYAASSSEGSMRDAESVLDQLSSFSKGKIRLEDAVESLGMINQETLFKAAGFIIGKDTKGALLLVGDILNSGKDARQFLTELLGHFRNIMIIKSGVSSEELIDLPKDAIEKIKTQSQGLSQGDIFYIISVLSNGLKMIKQLLPERIVLELCVIKLTSRDSISSIEEILAKLPELEKHSSGLPEPAPQAPRTVVPEKYSRDIKKADNNTEKAVLSSPSGASGSVEISRAKDAWPILVKAMAVKKMSISTYLAEGEPDSVNGHIISVAFPRELNFHREVLEEKHNKDAVEAALSQILDVRVSLRFIATDREIKKPEPESPSSIITKEELKKKEPIIDTALNIFGGKILRSTRNA
ncbi:MAG: DNA polymerase III subunit gamma/tau [Candidatus Omnitrophica bacterium]|nr:DNA polymerase III subunit gamma/tau [Candidatus Omnitrophota bacterium]MBU1933438.1 DNA polymerase III subunit gamma/tau [Candidatus Omnitrophota bacterium]